MSRIAAALATVALAVVPLAGCGADDVNPDALANAAEATREQGGAHMVMTGTVEAAGQKIPMTMEGDLDLERLAMHAKTEANGTIPEIEMVLLETTMFMTMPGLEQAFDGAEWVKVDLQEIGAEMGVDFGQLAQLSQASPAEQLKWLEAISDLEDLGEETIDGVKTTHYKGVVDMRKYPDTLPEAERAEARKMVDKLIEVSGSATTPTEVWVDEGSLVHRQKITTTQKKPIETRTELDIRYTDFGKDVDIRAPSGAKDITDLAAKGIEQQNGG